MDIIARAPSIQEDGTCAIGTLSWYDAEGNRYHVWVVHQPDGPWVLKRELPRSNAILYKKPPGEGRGVKVRHLDADADTHAATIKYVLEQQNAHGLIELEARGVSFRRNKERQELKEATARSVRKAALVWAETVEGETAEEIARLIGNLDTDSAWALSQALGNLEHT